MKQIFVTANGEVEFKNQEDLEKYFKGEKPNLKLDKKTNRYKASFK